MRRQASRSDSSGQVARSTRTTPIVPFLLSDFSETAAALMCLDLVITVDTAVAHLAGALGKTVWVMLPFVSDWRWLIARDDSPWYSTARLFRQQQRGDWDSVVECLHSALVE